MQQAGALRVVLMLCLATVVLVSGEAWGFPVEGRTVPAKKKFASWDEVNVIAHGLLQLGHGLKEHVDKTKGQVKDIYSQLTAHSSSFADLLRRAQAIQEEGELLRNKLRDLEDRDGRLFNLSEGMKGKLEEVGGEEEAMEKRLEKIEGKMRQVLQARLPEGGKDSAVGTLQAQMREQNHRIEDLFRKITQQQQQLDKQNLKIKNLQSKVSLLAPLQLKDNKTQSPKWRQSPRKTARHAGPSHNASREPPQPQELPLDCHQLFLEGERQSRVFWIQPAGSQPFLANCEMTPEGGWTVIQRRLDGSVDFNQPWETYKAGFGDPHGEFWLGLEKMHQLAQGWRNYLSIQLQDWEGNFYSAQFPFHLGGEDTDYSLQLLELGTGEAEIALGDRQPLPFSTWDKDHDLQAALNCAKHLSGGWWFSTCGHSNLNGKYFLSIPRQRHQRKKGIFWKAWRGRYYPLRATTMRIRPSEPKASS